MKQVLSIAFLLLISHFALAQNNTQQDEKPYIELVGHAEKKIVPDEIYVSITIRERESGRDPISVEQQEKDLKQALKDLNIPLELLTVADAQADYIRVKWSKKDVISQNEYELKLSNAQQVGGVFEKLDEIKIDNAFISRVSHSKIKEYEKAVEIEAIKNAKAKADYLLNAIGQQTGTAMVIKERGSNSSGTYYVDGIKMNGLDRLSGRSLSESDKYDDAIRFKKIKLESNIYTKFEIK